MMPFIHKVFSLLILASFLWATSFGVSMIMEVDANGGMPGCPFMAEQTHICQMGIGEHLLKWKQAFAALLLLVSFTAVFAVARRLRLAAFAGEAAKSLQFFRERASYRKVFDPLVTAFSEGILNSKIHLFA